MKGDLKTTPTNGLEHLPLVANVATADLDRNHLLLLEWEGEAPSSIGGVHISKRCADSPIGLAFTASLVQAATEEARSALPR